MTEYDGQLFVLAPLSVALIAIGFLQLLFPRLPAAVRIVASGCILAASLGAVSVFADNDAYAHFAVATIPASLALALPVRAVRSNSGTTAGGRRRAWAGPGIAAAGIALLALTVLRYETGLSDQTENDAGEMELFTFVPERVSDPERQLVTDRGQIIPLFQVKVPMARDAIDAVESRAVARLGLTPGTFRTEPANDATNCHGWVFTGGRSIVTNGDVETILADNDYRIVERPVPGDLAIYRNFGAVCHTAIVRVAEPGQTPIVEGKWSWMGVFREPVDRSIYGNDYAFYRTSRTDHLVKVFDRSTTPFTGAE